ncbi:hypothetical protein [Mucilaginibacter sp. UYCu711]|uniref:hypothetical protein n=1 Tax=Mucilaginibacter sp. UYCu711 TaxID=3156339 RepID=UPI003D1CD4EB
MNKSNTTPKTYLKASPYKDAPLRLFFDDIGFTIAQELAVFKSNTKLYARLRAPLKISLSEFYSICKISGEPSQNVIIKLLSYVKPGETPPLPSPPVRLKTRPKLIYKNYPLSLFFDKLGLSTAHTLTVFKNFPTLYRRITTPENLTIDEFIKIAELSNSNPGQLMAELLTQLNFTK